MGMIKRKHQIITCDEEKKWGGVEEIIKEATVRGRVEYKVIIKQRAGTELLAGLHWWRLKRSRVRLMYGSLN